MLFYGVGAVLEFLSLDFYLLVGVGGRLDKYLKLLALTKSASFKL